ncbi:MULTISPECIES: hypothetical protein [Lysinibacillus]|uniref:hypothetical protein n=1 Tax=Lysinibacillus TaxID=400634 RepID=UPI00257FC5FD|nr:MULTISPECIES: hypothetical protein [Lysinibacillus]
MVLAFISSRVLDNILGAQSNDETIIGISVLAIQNTAIITLLIYLVLKQNSKRAENGPRGMKKIMEALVGNTLLKRISTPEDIAEPFVIHFFKNH